MPAFPATSTTPVVLRSDLAQLTFDAISAGYYHTCGLRAGQRPAGVLGAQFVRGIGSAGWFGPGLLCRH